MKLSSLLEYLLANRHKLSDGAIVDCLDLALVVSEANGERVPRETLARRWGCMNQPYLSQRMRRLAKAGLVDYEAGVCGDPGYLFLRFGPPPHALIRHLGPAA